MNHLGSKRIETNRLVLRKDSKEDVDLLWKYLYSDKDAVKKCDWVDFKDKDDFISKVRFNNSNNVYCWTIWLKDINVPIGGISIHHQDDSNGTCQVGYSIHPNYWGNGFATESLKAITNFMIFDVGYIKITAICHTNNLSSKKVIENSDYSFVKKNVKSYMHHGKLLDTFEYEYLNNSIRL